MNNKERRELLISARRDINRVIHSYDPEPLPPDPHPYETDERLGFGGTMFLWFLWQAWKPRNEAAVIDEASRVIARFAENGYGRNETLAWIKSGRSKHRHLAKKTPWENGLTGGVNLDKFHDRYFYLLRKFIEINLMFNVEVEYCLTMRDDYVRRAIGSVYDRSKWPYLQKLGEKVCRAYREAYGDPNYKPWIKIANELMHGGNIDRFHENGQFHFAMADYLIRNGHTTIDKIKVNLTESEGCQIYLNEPLPCGKPYTSGEIHGDERFNRRNPKRSILAEKGGYGCVKNITEGDTTCLNWLDSNWQRYELSGDGGCYPYGTNGFLIPGSTYRQSNPQEAYERAKYYQQKCKEKGKRGYECLWLFEIYAEKTVDNMNYNEHWEYDIILWDRVEEFARGFRDGNK